MGTVCALSYVMANPTTAVVAAALCIALAAAWTALLKNSPIDPANIDLPHPPQRLGVFAHNKRLQNPHKFGSGSIPNPEDLVFDSQGRLYTGCGDGWIKRISFLDNLDVLVENWTYVGGRPLGLVFGSHGELLVCEPSQGLLNVTEDHVEILTDEADGLKVKFADGVDASREGAVYFTDASYKYGFHDHLFDILEYRPHGRLLKYEPSTKRTNVLLTDLYFPNGVALSAKQDFLVFCETSLYRCQKYWLKGPEKGTVESFIDNLPGLPDNIHYDGNGTFWIGIPTSRTLIWRMATKFPSVRHVLALMTTLSPRVVFDAIINEPGVLAVNEMGNPIALYSDPNSKNQINTGLKRGECVYYGSLTLDYIGRVPLTQEIPIN